jgi:hypothetical protein
MGIVIRFPHERSERAYGRECLRSEPANIIILPVIRVERHQDEMSDGPDTGAAAGGKRRRRSTRS